MGAGEITTILIVTQCGFVGIFLFLLYRKIPTFIKNKFAICLKCYVIDITKNWDKPKQVICTKCSSQMEIMEMPVDYHLRRVNNHRKLVLILSPVVLVLFLIVFNLYISLTLLIPLFCAVIIFGILSERRFKADLLHWAKSSG